MDTQLLKDLAAVPTSTFKEELMVKFLLEYGKARGWDIHADKHLNVYVRKGRASFYPCVSAHIDSVQPLTNLVDVQEAGGHVFAYRKGTRNRAGFGADDKSGILICLELLDRLPVISACFFSGEECGSQGARKCDAGWMAGVGYLVEFDCPSRDMVSYTAGGIRLFDDDGAFIKKAHPVLCEWGSTLWQRHPYTDVTVLRQRFDFPCLNLSSGYYNWHAANEYIKLADTKRGLELGYDLVRTLGCQRYIDTSPSTGSPLCEVTKLRVPANPDLHMLVG